MQQTAWDPLERLNVLHRSQARISADRSPRGLGQARRAGSGARSVRGPAWHSRELDRCAGIPRRCGTCRVRGTSTCTRSSRTRRSPRASGSGRSSMPCEGAACEPRVNLRREAPRAAALGIGCGFPGRPLTSKNQIRRGYPFNVAPGCLLSGPETVAAPWQLLHHVRPRPGRRRPARPGGTDRTPHRRDGGPARGDPRQVAASSSLASRQDRRALVTRRSVARRLTTASTASA